jgi:tripeptidyl-peptidase I
MNCCFSLSSSLARIVNMFILKSLSTVVILAAVCIARPTSSVVFEKLENVPAGWIKDDSARVDKDATSISLKIHLINNDMDTFHELAMNVRYCSLC